MAEVSLCTRAVVWTKPDDLQYDPEKPLAGLGNAHPGVFGALFADGSVHILPTDLDQKILAALLTRNGKEDVDSGDF